MNTQPDKIYKETELRIYDNSFISKFLSKYCNYYDKAVNPTYATFKGGYGSWNDDMSQWDYFCLWGHLRFCYNKTDLIDGWTHIGLHGYRNGYTYTPVKKLLWNFDWHFAYNKKFPFIKIGFKNIENLFNEL